MKMCLVMKVFIFSKTMIICLLCPLLCGLFFFWKGAKGELSYKVKNRAQYKTVISHGFFSMFLVYPGGFHDSFRQQANIHNRGVLLVLGADKKCGDATRIIITGNLRFRIRQDQCKLFIRINFFVFLIVFNVFSDSID